MSSDESTRDDASIAPALAARQPPPRRWASSWMWGLGWLYVAVLLLLACLCLWHLADRHWSGTLLEFAPRWILLLPVPLFVLLAVLHQRRFWWIAGLALLIGLGPLTGICVPWPLRLGPGEHPPLRVLTLNTDGRASPDEVVALAKRNEVDVICLQECYRPEIWLRQLGDDWHLRHEDEFLVASRYPISNLEVLIEEDRKWDRLAVRCEIAGPLGTIQLVNLHTHSPRDGLEAVLHRKSDALEELAENSRRRELQSQRISQWIAAEQRPIVIAGDFNQAAGSRAYAECWGRYLNAYSEAGIGWGATFFSRWHGVRIDHVLASGDFQAVECWVADDVGSAHRPVIATLQFTR